MIRELNLDNIEINNGERNILAHNIQGKILKVLFNPSTGNHGVRLRIFTKEGELIMDVTQQGLYYPRANVSSEKMVGDAFSHEGDYKDYYYFNKELLFNITTSEPNFEGVVIDKLVLMYEETESQTVISARILQEIANLKQEIINSKQEEFESGRRETRLFR